MLQRDFLFAGFQHQLMMSYLTCSCQSNPRVGVQGTASVASGTPAILLSSMTTEAVCERVRQIDGIDQSMTGQYSATIRKVGVSPWWERASGAASD